MRLDPRCSRAVGIWVWDVDCSVGDLARTGEALDVERVVGRERAKG
jgi:hypothetical protein